MPFTFKLSQRLARFRALSRVMLATPLLTACDLRRQPITGAVDPVAQVIVSPDTITLDPFQRYDFRAFGRTQAGDSVAVAVTYTATGGTISASGTYTAGQVAGDYHVIAAQSGGENALADTAAVTVTAGAPPSGSNEPAGFTTLVDRSFSGLTELGWGASALLSLATDLSAPRSAPAVGQVTYPAGFGGGSDPAMTWLAGVESRGYRQLYLSFWVKLSSNWQGHGSGVNKIGFVWLHGNPVVYFSAQGSGSGPLEPQIRLQNTPAGARNLTPNLGGAVHTRGEWHRWEIVLVVNDGDQANGQAHWWIDGVKVGQYTDVLYGTSGQSKVWGDEVSWKPIWGGTGETVQQTMYMWMDHFYISGKQ